MDDIPWIEKYRPKNYDDLLLPESLKLEIKHMIENKTIDNMILTGPSGIGKTTTVNCIMHKLYGPYVNQHVLKINASDDRGIKIYSIILNFCKSVLFYKNEDIGKYANCKLIVCDEADNITTKAQKLLNFIMTKYENTKFIFTCNNSYKLNRAIQSKCKIIKYPKMIDNLMFNRLQYICEKENIDIENVALECIIKHSDGDIRCAINNLNAITNRYGNIIRIDDIIGMCDNPNTEMILNIVDKCINKDLYGAIMEIENIKKKGFNIKDIIFNIFNILKSDIKLSMTEKNRIEFLKIVAYTLFKLSKHNENNLQIYKMISKIILLS